MLNNIGPAGLLLIAVVVLAVTRWPVAAVRPSGVIARQSEGPPERRISCVEAHPDPASQTRRVRS